MIGRLSGRVAVVTGGSSGIGLATCLRFAEEGARVIAADIESTAVKEIVATGTVSAAHLDVASEESWLGLLDDVREGQQRLDILVNCAGIGVAGNLEELSLDDWNRLIAVNLTGPFLGIKHALPIMRECENGGSIINVSSIAGIVGGEDLAGYSASKGGLTVFTKSAALYCARHAPGVRCNSVHPTYVDSPMLDPVAVQFGSRRTMLEGMAAEVPLGRVAVPDDVADAMIFLASDESRMMTGAQLVLDGGQLAGIPSRHSG